MTEAKKFLKDTSSREHHSELKYTCPTAVAAVVACHIQGWLD
jgi:hypothetical protein